MTEEQFLKFWAEKFGEEAETLKHIDRQIVTGDNIFEVVNEAIDYYMTEIYDRRTD